jgi:hypothetical protein
VAGHLEVDQLATAMAHEEEDEEGLERQGLDDKEVGGPDRVRMVGKEGAPALAGWAGVTTSTIAADRAGADDDTELEELAPDALGAPERWLWLAIVAINSRIAGLNRGRPRRRPECQR